MQKGRDNPKFRGGSYTGLTEYRYGAQVKAITLAGGKTSAPSSSVPLLKGEKRKHVVQKMMDVLSDWRNSPFEKEGPTRSGLRSALCAAGSNWDRADLEAERIVAHALRLLGAERPDWEEGQRHYVEPRENCKWCGFLLPEVDQKFGFCSAEHARSALSHWGFKDRSSADIAYGMASRAANALAKPRCECANPDCRKKFTPTTNVGRYCSHSCAAQYERVVTWLKPCVTCGTAIETKSAKTKFCCKRCEHIHYGWRPKVMLPELFDFYFRPVAA